MKNMLNRFAIWLYKKTKKDLPTPEQILGGLEVVESRHLPKGKCFIGTAEANLLQQSFLQQEIKLTTPRA